MRRVFLSGSLRNLYRMALAALLLTASVAGADDWPQWLGPRRDGVWRETGIIEQIPSNGLKVRWRTPVAQGYAGPAVADGRVYVIDFALPPGVAPEKDGFNPRRKSGKERVLCLDEKTGKVEWTHEYDCTYDIGYPGGPRATPTVSGGKVYTLGAMGDLCCLDARKGTLLWSKNFMKDYGAPKQIWGFAAAPLVDGEKLICLVGGPDSTAVAFHKDTGKEIWRSLKDGEHGYCPPVIIEASGKRQLIIWTPAAVNSLDPESGKVYWSQPFRLKAGLSIPTPRQFGDLLLVSSFYNGSMMLKLDPDKPGAKVLWKSQVASENPDRTDTLNSIIPTPYIKDGYIYGVCSYGELRCLEAETGKRLWMTRQPTTGEALRWGNAFLIPNGDRFFLFNEKGELIIAKLTPKGYEEISRTKVLEPTNAMATPRGRMVVWMHPAFANKCMYARNDKEIVCVSLAAEDYK